ncbi:response regulator [Marinobacter salinisoli]|nr:response regulator [Marinobacter salinisoli]
MARSLPAGLNTHVLFAGDGAEALELLREEKADLLFLDLNMPNMDGYEVLERAQSEDLPVITIVVSGDIQPEARQRVSTLGAIGFIKKPTDTELVQNLLREYGLYPPQSDLTCKLASEDCMTASAASLAKDSALTLPDYLQELANVAMGRSTDLLARLLDVFIKQPIPKVGFLANSELQQAISAARDSGTYSTVCQGFTGAGLAGEALLIFSDSSLAEMAQMLDYESTSSDSVRTEVLMDMSSILFGAFLKGFGDQLDLNIGLGRPAVLGHQRQVSELLQHHRTQDEQLLCIEIVYTLEGKNIQCDMLVLFTEASLAALGRYIEYLAD